MPYIKQTIKSFKILSIIGSSGKTKDWMTPNYVSCCSSETNSKVDITMSVV